MLKMTASVDVLIVECQVFRPSRAGGSIVVENHDMPSVFRILLLCGLLSC